MSDWRCFVRVQKSIIDLWDVISDINSQTARLFHGVNVNCCICCKYVIINRWRHLFSQRPFDCVVVWHDVYQSSCHYQFLTLQFRVSQLCNTTHSVCTLWQNTLYMCIHHRLDWINMSSNLQQCNCSLLSIARPGEACENI